MVDQNTEQLGDELGGGNFGDNQGDNNSNNWGNMFDWVGKIFEAITSLPQKILDGLKDILKWFFYVDFSKISEKLNFQEKLESKFKIFFDISNKFKNINSGSVENAIIQMNLPQFLGGQKVTILDLTVAKPVLDWGKIFLKFSLWISFANWIIGLFEPKFGIN